MHTVEIYNEMLKFSGYLNVFARNNITIIINRIFRRSITIDRTITVQENRWRKRGLAVMPMLWPYGVPPVVGYGVFISVYAADATVVVAPGGVEMGQGLNTKVNSSYYYFYIVI